MVTIRQLAELSGCSRQTVIRALHDTGRISPDTKQRILELAALYQYKRPVQEMRADGTSARGIALMTTRIGYPPFNAYLMKGVAEVAFEHGFHLTLMESHNQLTHIQRAFFALEEIDVKGVIALTGHEKPIPKRTVLDLWSHGIYLVAVDASTPIEVATDRVWTDERQLADLAISYLVELGHRRIAYIGPSSADRPVGRTYAVRERLRQQGLPFDWFVDSGLWFGALDEQEFSTAIMHMLRAKNRPTAVFCFSDDIAALVLLLAHRLQLSVPERLSVIGCANFPMSQHFIPPLTTIDQDPMEIGRQAMALILTHIDGGQEPALCPPSTIAVPACLIKRGSCARPSRE
jgi:DNA-binding LacI/PurR family transcriptional regulator